MIAGAPVRPGLAIFLPEQAGLRRRDGVVDFGVLRKQAEGGRPRKSSRGACDLREYPEPAWAYLSFTAVLWSGVARSFVPR